MGLPAYTHFSSFSQVAWKLFYAPDHSLVQTPFLVSLVNKIKAHSLWLGNIRTFSALVHFSSSSPPAHV